MQCKVCGYEVEKGKAKCPKCNFPVIVMTAGSEEEKRKIDEMAENYREKKMQKVKVYLEVYTNELDGDNVKSKPDWILLLNNENARELDKIQWFDEKFARLSQNPVLSIKFHDTKGNETTKEVTVKKPDSEDFWQVGISVKEGFNVQIFVGNASNYEASELISLM